MNKKLSALTGALLVCAGTVMFSPAASAGEGPLWSAASTYRQDAEATSFEEAFTYKLFTGKPIKDAVADFDRMEEWKRIPHSKAAAAYERQGKGYYEIMYIYPQSDYPDLIGDFRISFYVKEKAMAEEIFAQIAGNFLSTLGRPGIRRGSSSYIWLLSRDSRIVVECMEYDPRLPVASSYPFEIVINRQHDDYSGYFEDKSRHA